MRDAFPAGRGRNEPSTTPAVVGFAKIRRRRQVTVAAPSIGPGGLDTVTAGDLGMVRPVGS